MRKKTRLINELSCNPYIGDIIQGTGGFRKLRFARQGSGKSGGYRVVYFFASELTPIFLVSIYAKNTQENISDKQRNELRAIAKIIKGGW